jgi:hypothetical protein
MLRHDGNTSARLHCEKTRNDKAGEMMEQAEKVADLKLDRPLLAVTALQSDTLGRRAFARRVTGVLQRISPEAGLVVSVEGSWGCGKTSVLAMVEALLEAEPEEDRPLVVHFNPWLIGDLDALLRQFLASIAKAVKLTDPAKEGKRVAKELKTYSKAFDVLKLIPGAEPWASIVKSVVESVGNAGEAVFDHKTPDIEASKRTLEQALRKFPRRIVVLIDDIDRLYPAEVYEMVRIIKAVGDLPNVGYLLAWDEKFVSAALENLKVPYAAAYLDKVVQVRLPVPPLSFTQRVNQMNRGLARLPEEAHETYFPKGDERHGLVFHHGLSELMQHPRDVVRLFDVVASIEPDLRGEIHLADLIGLAALMNKAPSVFALLRRTPQAFVGRRPGTKSIFQKSEEVLEAHADERNAAIEGCSNPKAVRDLIHCLFPKTAKADEAFGFDRVVFTEGHLAHPDRLSVALQLSAGAVDVSLVKVRRFLFHPQDRETIAAELNDESCASFLDCLGSVLEDLSDDVVLDTQALAIELARIIERPAFVRRARHRTEVWLQPAETTARQAIGSVAKRMTPEAAEAMAELLICDAEALSIAVDIAFASYVQGRKDEGAGDVVRSRPESRNRTMAALAKNLERAAASGELFDKVNPGRILWFASQLIPARCKAIFRAVQKHEPTLDKLVVALFGGSFDSLKGQSYAVPKEVDRVEKYVSMAVLKRLAVKRLEEKSLGFPARAAWLAVAKGKSIYGKDGSAAER